MPNDDEILFEVTTPLDKRIRTTEEYWNFIVTVKHPILKGKKNKVKKSLEDPNFIRRSTKDRRVFLYYKRAEDKFICAVCKHLAREGFIITAYITDKVKEGEEVWTRD